MGTLLPDIPPDRMEGNADCFAIRGKPILLTDGCNRLHILLSKSDGSLFVVHAPSIPT